MVAFRLTAIQRLLLVGAAQRDDGSLLPMSPLLGEQEAIVREAFPVMLERQLIEEVAVADAALMWRREGKTRFGLIITAAGRASVERKTVEEPKARQAAPEVNKGTAVKSLTKIGMVAEMLRRDGGATIAELTDATGWLNHTTRAALTGLRKKGHEIAKIDREGVTAYSVRVPRPRRGKRAG